jgi:hypothetical protein
MNEARNIGPLRDTLLFGPLASSATSSAATLRGGA